MTPAVGDTRTEALGLHPAKFSPEILSVLDRMVTAERRRLKLDRPLLLVDPFAGVGRIHQLAKPGKLHTLGVEIEREWACNHRDTVVGDCRPWLAEHAYVAFLDTCDLSAHPFPENHNGADIVATSVCYANRFSDHHEARDGSTRRSYRHDLGRMPSEGSAATMGWRTDYRHFHAEVYRLILDALRPGGLLILNVSDIVRDKVIVPTATWHWGACLGAGFEEVGRGGITRIPTRRMRYGENHGHDGEQTRAEYEIVYKFRRPQPHG